MDELDKIKEWWLIIILSKGKWKIKLDIKIIHPSGVIDVNKLLPIGIKTFKVTFDIFSIFVTCLVLKL